MRFLRAAGFLAAGTALPLAAQETNAPPADKSALVQEKLIGFLSPADQDRVVAAYERALADNPKLKRERKELEMVWMQLAEANPQERMAFVEKNRAHNQKIREAMLKADPSLGPILELIDQHLSAMRAEREKALTNGSGTAAP